MSKAQEHDCTIMYCRKPWSRGIFYFYFYKGVEKMRSVKFCVVTILSICFVNSLSAGVIKSEYDVVMAYGDVGSESMRTTTVCSEKGTHLPGFGRHHRRHGRRHFKRDHFNKSCRFDCRSI